MPPRKSARNAAVNLDFLSALLGWNKVPIAIPRIPKTNKPASIGNPSVKILNRFISPPSNWFFRYIQLNCTHLRAAKRQLYSILLLEADCRDKRPSAVVHQYSKSSVDGFVAVGKIQSIPSGVLMLRVHGRLVEMKVNEIYAMGVVHPHWHGPHDVIGL